jgi:serine/threonine protein kinase
MYKCLQALNFMDKRNCCHRDISINNILVRDNEDIRLIDFGFSKRWSNDEI